MKLDTATFICITASAMFISGCKKPAQPPQVAEGELTFSAQKSVAKPSEVPPPLPDPVVPKGAESPSPMPGQAGDTSSEAFKNGGAKDPHK
ncbi:MAG: hypothetical protein Q7T62_01815 [Undibacterium sp.]|nr:hypothetical protein [Undibacterium sp.]